MAFPGTGLCALCAPTPESVTTTLGCRRSFHDAETWNALHCTDCRGSQQSQTSFEKVNSVNCLNLSNFTFTSTACYRELTYSALTSLLFS